jgi:uncharacterized protein
VPRRASLLTHLHRCDGVACTIDRLLAYVEGEEGKYIMLLTGDHIRALDALKASEVAGSTARTVAEDETDTYRVLELQRLARPETGRAYVLTAEGREALRLLAEMRVQALLPPTDKIARGWRFIGSEVLAALAAAGRAEGRVGPLAEDLLRERGLAEDYKDRERKNRYLRLNAYGTAWLAYAQRHKPRLEVTGDLAQSIHDMPPAYADPHQLKVSAAHRAQLEAMRLLVWSVPDREVFTLTALGKAVYEALRKGGYPIANVVLDDDMLTLLATLAERGAGVLAPEQLAEVQMLGYAGPDGSLEPAGEAALRARQLLDAQPSRPPAAFTITRHEAELLDVVHQLSEEKNGTAQPATKAVLHKALIDGLERRYQDFVGKYGRKINEVPARKRQEQEMLAELRDRDRAYGDPAHLDELLVHLESFELLRAEAEGQATVYQLTPNGQRVVKEQGKSPRAITGTGVKAVTITTMAGLYYAPVAGWIEHARDEELIGPGGITASGNFYAWLAEHARRWPALTRTEAQMLLNLPQDEPRSGDRQDRRTSRGDTGDEDEQERTLDRLEANGLIERMVDGQILRTESGQLLMRAVAGALELAYPVTPWIVRLLRAVRQVGESLYVKEPKVRIQPHQWVEVERLTGLGPDEFRETVHLAKLGKYLGEANLHDAGLDVLEVLAKTNAQA